MFQHLILGLLRDGKQRHAYAVAAEHERLTGNPSYPANASRELHKLADQGFVIRETNSPGDDERRIPYVITPPGCEMFDAWLVSTAAVDSDFSTWTLFIDRVPPDTRDHLLDRREEDLWIMLKNANRAREDALTHARGNGGKPFSPAAINLRRRIMQISADLEFIRELRGELANLPPNGRGPGKKGDAR